MHAPDRPLLFRNIAPETLILALICLADLVTTLYWVSQGRAREGNPLMAHVLGIGEGAFISVKVATFLPALVAAEWYRPRNPRLITKVLRWVILFYVAIYVGGVAAHVGQPVEFYSRAILG